MTMVNVNVRTDVEINAKCKSFYENLGMAMSTAINMFSVDHSEQMVSHIYCDKKIFMLGRLGCRSCIIGLYCYFADEAVVDFD